MPQICGRKAEKPKRYRTFLFFGPQNQQKREKKERKPKEFLEIVTKKCSFLYTKKAYSFNSAVVRGVKEGGELLLILVI